MRTFRLGKLIRDGVFSSMQELGQETEYTLLSGAELDSALQAKLVEEVEESDLIDLLEVVEHIGVRSGKTFEQLRAEQLKKRELVGGFAGGVFVKSITVKDEDTWAQYYAAEPERFPEVME